MGGSDSAWLMVVENLGSTGLASPVRCGTQATDPSFRYVFVHRGETTVPAEDGHGSVASDRNVALVAVDEDCVRRRAVCCGVK